MLPRFLIPIGFCMVDNTGEGKAEAEGTKAIGIDEEADDANRGMLGWTIKGIVEDAVTDATEILLTLTYHNLKIENPRAYLEIGSSKLTT